MDDQRIYHLLPDPRHSIRLLSIQPGWPSDPLSVGLITIHDRRDAPPYDALSYVWGTTLDPTPILCNGVSKQVTASLADALRAFRPLPLDANAIEHGVSVLRKDDVLHSSRNAWRDFAVNSNERDIESRSEPFLIWIDALCINQDDWAERADQVIGMREIYADARMVRVWFGQQLIPTAQPRSVKHIASSALDRFLGRLHLAEYGDMPVVLTFLAQALRNSTMNTETLEVFEFGFPPTHAAEWEILRNFFEQPWFHRVWTVQEVVMATNAMIVVGDWEIEWKAFVQATMHLRRSTYAWSTSMGEGVFKVSWRALPLEPVSYMCQISRYFTRRPLLLGLLILGRVRVATQPVDHVFAVLGLTSEWCAVEDGEVPLGEHELTPNYSKSVSDVFIDVTRWIILFHISLDVLSAAELDESGIKPGFPTWVPAWSRKKKSYDLAHASYRWTPNWSTFKSTHRRLMRETSYDADSKEPMALIRFDKERDGVFLCLNGLRFDAAVAVSEPLKAALGYDHLTSRIKATPEQAAFVSSAWNLVERLILQNHRNETRDESTSHLVGIEQDITELSFTGLEAPYKTAEDLLSAFIITLCANQEGRGGDEKKVDDENEDFRAWRPADQNPAVYQQAKLWLSQTFRGRIYSQTLVEKLKSLTGVIGNPIDISGVNFQSSISMFCTWRRFFVTRSGHIGIGPMSMEEGDVVVVLFGSTVPFVLRSQLHLGREHRYMFIGECYVHGIMKGEVVQKWRGTDAPAEVFELV